MSESVHRHRESAPEHVRLAVLTISDTRTLENDTGGDTIEEPARRRSRDRGEANRKGRCGAHPDGDREPARPSRRRRCHYNRRDRDLGRDTTYEVVDRMIEKKPDGFGEIFRALSYEEIGAAAILSRAAAARSAPSSSPASGSRNAVRLAVEKLSPEIAHVILRTQKASEGS